MVGNEPKAIENNSLYISQISDEWMGLVEIETKFAALINVYFQYCERTDTFVGKLDAILNSYEGHSNYGSRGLNLLFSVMAYSYK